jgi:hypothetical protein
VLRRLFIKSGENLFQVSLLFRFEGGNSFAYLSRLFLKGDLRGVTDTRRFVAQWVVIDFQTF